MLVNTLIRRIRRSLKKDGLSLVTTRYGSRDYWQMGDYSLVDENRCIVCSDINLVNLAFQRGLLNSQDNISMTV